VMRCDRHPDYRRLLLTRVIIMMLIRALMVFCNHEDSGSAVSLGRPDVLPAKTLGDRRMLGEMILAMLRSQASVRGGLMHNDSECR